MCGGKWSRPNLRYYSSICLEGLSVISGYLNLLLPSLDVTIIILLTTEILILKCYTLNISYIYDISYPSFEVKVYGRFKITNVLCFTPQYECHILSAVHIKLSVS
jgi:hypothetical protein